MSTNFLDWANFGSMNLSASVSLQRRVTLGASASYNPWTFRYGDSYVYNRHRTFGVHCDIWPWHVSAGWSLRVGLQQKQYAVGGLFSLTEEGNAWGAGVAFNYSRLLSRDWNLKFGAGLWGGKKTYTRYRCPGCGRRMEEGSAWFVAPYGMAVSLVYVLPLGERSRAERTVRVPLRDQR